jgi:hypothetical protein
MLLWTATGAAAAAEATTAVRRAHLSVMPRCRRLTARVWVRWRSRCNNARLVNGQGTRRAEGRRVGSAIHTVIVVRYRARLSRYLCDLAGVLAQPNQLRAVVGGRGAVQGFPGQGQHQSQRAPSMGEVAFSKSAPSASTKTSPSHTPSSRSCTVPFLPPSDTVRCPLPCRAALHLTLHCRQPSNGAHLAPRTSQLAPRGPRRSPSRFSAAPAPWLPPRLACAVPCPRPPRRSELAAQRLSHQLSSPHPPNPLCSAALACTGLITRSLPKPSHSPLQPSLQAHSSQPRQHLSAPAPTFVFHPSPGLISGRNPPAHCSPVVALLRSTKPAPSPPPGPLPPPSAAAAPRRLLLMRHGQRL